MSKIFSNNRLTACIIAIVTLMLLASSADAQRRRKVSSSKARTSQTAAKPSMEEPALSFYQKAKTDDAAAQLDLAFCYYKGNGVEEDNVKAIEWAKKSAAQGFPEACVLIGWVYQSGGEGVTENQQEANLWFKKALELATPMAENGNARALMALSHLYEYGDGVEQNKELSHQYLKKSAENGYAKAQDLLGDAYMNGDIKVDGPEMVSKEERNELVNSFYENLKRESGLQDFSIIYLANAILNLQGKSETVTDEDAAMDVIYDYICKQSEVQSVTDESKEKQKEESIKWYLKAAEQGYSYSQYSLAEIYDEEEDYSQAAKWYQKAAEQGNDEAQVSLGYYYEEGKGGLPQNNEMAVKWYRAAANKGNARAQTNLGICYDNGIGVAKNPQEAANWYRKAAEQDYARAQWNLYCCYRDGEGVAKNMTIANQWLQKAADNDYEKAIAELEKKEREEANRAKTNKINNELTALKNKIGVSVYNNLNAGYITKGMKWSSIMAFRDYINKYNYVSGATIIDNLPSEVKVGGITLRATKTTSYVVDYAILFSNRRGGDISGGFISVRNGVVTSVNLERAR